MSGRRGGIFVPPPAAARLVLDIGICSDGAAGLRSSWEIAWGGPLVVFIVWTGLGGWMGRARGLEPLEPSGWWMEGGVGNKYKR